jgi:hypothetical protein
MLRWLMLRWLMLRWLMLRWLTAAPTPADSGIQARSLGHHCCQSGFALRCQRTIIRPFTSSMAIKAT